MIELLTIKNVALIEYTEISFGDGLNILSGETGSGKSMLIDALSFVLGERFSKDFIRTGEQTAEVTAIFSISDKILESLFKDYAFEEDGQIVLNRVIHTNGRTICKINNKVVTVSALKELSSCLIDMHGQHEHQSLLNQSKHIQLLDKFCENEIASLKSELSENIKQYKEITKEMKKYIIDEKDKEARLSILTFQKNEIESASLKKDEEDLLNDRRKRLTNVEKLSKNAEEALLLLNGNDEYVECAYNLITKASGAISFITQIDKEKENLLDSCNNVLAELSDLVLELKNYTEQIEFEPDELFNIETRLDLILSLKRKYGNSIEDIFKTLEEVSKEIDFLLDSQKITEHLLNEKKKILLKINSVCESISKIRKENSQIISSKIVDILKELGMKDVNFVINVDRKKEFGLNGFDNVEFLISPNSGEPLKPLAKIASGGEMSRVMLSLKSVLALADQIETFVFDEIDTGVSGRTAQKVAERLNILGKTHQILCISHLPQIAAMAKNHYLIEKKNIENRTFSTITCLNYEEQISELARLLGGASITDMTLQAAKELKDMAVNI